MSDSTREDLIRARAHQIWEDEGRPEGQEADHWNRASAELDEAGAGHERGDEEGNVPPNVAGPKGRNRNKG